MRLTTIAGLIIAAAGSGACASVARPPGGPEDKGPPEILSISVDTNATNVSAGKIEVRFNEIISERPSAAGPTGGGPVSLDAIVLVSPRTGSAKVQWHRDRLTIEPRGGFRPNTSYRITLLPGVADIRGNVRTTSTSFVFSTGPTLQPFSILGRVFDWPTNGIASGAVVEAVEKAGTPDSLIHIAIADTTGQFEVGPLGPGRYLLRAFVDADRNRERGILEKWDTLTVEVTDHRPAVELRAIQRDTAGIGIERVEVLDSLWLRVMLDKPFDPRTTLQPALVVLKRADSSEVQVVGVMTEAQASSVRPRADTTQARPTTPPATDIPSTRPPAPRPAIPPPERTIILRLNPSTPLRPGERYSLLLRGIRNLTGNAPSATTEFEAPRAKPPQ